MVPVYVVNKLAELLELIENSLESRPGPRWFRGSSSFEKHQLIPTLLRHPEVKAGAVDALDLEDRLTARLKQTSPPFLFSKPDSQFDWMFLAQHYGVPTRLLDWSENPFIALYFALSSSSNDTPVVWALDPLQWDKESLANPGLPRVLDPADEAAKRFLESLRDDLAPRKDPIAIYATHTNPRVVAQRGTFTLFGLGNTPMELLPYASKCLTCYLVNPMCKSELHKKLLSIGYTHSVIYPDLSGLGTEIKTTFGFEV